MKQVTDLLNICNNSLYLDFEDYLYLSELNILDPGSFEFNCITELYFITLDTLGY